MHADYEYDGEDELLYVAYQRNVEILQQQNKALFEVLKQVQDFFDADCSFLSSSKKLNIRKKVADVLIKYGAQNEH